MTIPTIREFRDEDAQTILRFPQVDPYAPFEPTGPAFTLEAEGNILACVGYEAEEDVAKCWMILSPDSVKYPRVFWAMRSLLDEVFKIGYKRVLTMVSLDWPEAQRFIKWMKFAPIGTPIFCPDGRFYTVYERVA